jgi:hypothetical protein
MGVTAWITKQVLARQLKGLPQDQVDMIMALMEQKPELFKKIAEETDARIKKGEHQMFATMEVMKKYRAQLAEIMQANPALASQLQNTRR